MNKYLRVLLVDDDEDEYVLIKGMFARLPGQGGGLQHTLDWAASYDEAIKLCTTGRYDIHLVDYHLGSHNGLDLMQAAQQHGCTAPFILLTGQGSYELDLAAMQQGAADYLLKDQINEYLLERSIRYSLERKQAQDELEMRVQERTQELAQANQELQKQVERRIRVEEILRESETRFRALAETTSAAIFIVQNKMIRYANPAARIVTGYAPEELINMELWRLAHPSYQNRLRQDQLVTQWAENIPARYEIKIITRKGEERWLDVTVGKLDYDHGPAWLFTAFEITERDLAEQALRRAKAELEMRVAQRTAEIRATSQRLETVMRTLPVAIVIADSEGQVIEGNDSFYDLWQINSHQLEQVQDWQNFKAWWSETGEQLNLADWPLIRAINHGETTIGKVMDIQNFQGHRKTIISSAVPILSTDGEVVGGVSVDQDITHQRQLEQQAQMAAREAQQRADELEGLHRATAALLSTLELDELLCQILDAAQSAIPAGEKGTLHLVSPSTGQLQVRATLGFSDERIRVIHSPKSRNFSAVVTRTRQPLLVDDVLTQAVPEGDPEEMKNIRSLISAPLKYGDQVLGALTLSSTRPNAFTEGNLRLLVSFAATTTAALQNAILHAEVRQLAVSDPLTGQYNRRAFFDLGRREIERFQRFNHPLSAVMIDLDNFKQVNDVHGHAVGDQILRMIAERARNSIRETDIFGRYGGDEFTLLLPDTDLFSAQHIANRIREAVNSISLVSEHGIVKVTISVGVAQAQKAHHTLEDLLSGADQALYRAKANGRNRVEAA